MAVLLSVFTLIIVAIAFIGGPKNMENNRIHGSSREDTVDKDGVAYQNSTSLTDRINKTFHKEFGERKNEDLLKVREQFTGKLIEQPLDLEIEDNLDLDDGIIGDDDGIIGDDDEVEDIEKGDEEIWDNVFIDPLLKKSKPGIIYNIHGYINGEIKNNGYLSILTLSRSEDEFRSVNRLPYSVILTSAKSSVSYIHYYDNVIEQISTGDEELRNSWKRVYAELVKYKAIVDKIDTIEDLPTYIGKLNNLKLVSEVDLFIDNTLKYIIDYDPLLEEYYGTMEENIIDGIIEDEENSSDNLQDGIRIDEKDIEEGEDIGNY